MITVLTRLYSRNKKCFWKDMHDLLTLPNWVKLWENCHHCLIPSISIMLSVQVMDQNEYQFLYHNIIWVKSQSVALLQMKIRAITLKWLGYKVTCVKNSTLWTTCVNHKIGAQKCTLTNVVSIILCSPGCLSVTVIA